MKKDVLRNLANFIGKITVPESFFNNVSSLRHASLLKKRPGYEYIILNIISPCSGSGFFL